MRMFSAVVTLLAGVLGAAPAGLAAADRAVVWLQAQDGGFERDLNRQATRGFRLAAISDGLPCAVAALQTPEKAEPPAVYRVVMDRALGSVVQDLTREGFVPRGSARMAGTRHQVVFERTTAPPQADEWRAIEFEKIEDLAAALSAAASEGFQVKLAVRPPFRSWPGLSEKGVVLARKPPAGGARQARVIVGSNRDLKDVIGPLQTATAEGWTLDGLLTSSRDGGREARRERVLLMLSRGGDAAGGAAVGIERHTSFGLFGKGVLAGAGQFWNDYLTAWVPNDRRQNWATPIRLSPLEASCAGLELKLRFDGMNDQASNIVALIGKPSQPDGFELVVVTEQRLGF
ncbi:MAG: hypothetical protein ABI880_13200 [Acidobacteriota bacterium]